MPSIAEETMELVTGMVISRYMIGAGLTIMMWDWLLTFDIERKYIWRARWSKVKTVFLINRYTVPLVIAFAAYGWSGQAQFLTPYSCKIWISADAAYQLAFFATLHWIVAMRAWTLYGRTALVAFIIWGGFVAYLGTAVYLTAAAMIAIEAAPVPGVNVCFGDLPQFLWSIWLPSMVFETLIFILTAIKAVHHNRHRVETPILTILYRDGFLYFIFICINSFTNLLVWAVAPAGLVLVARYFTMAICQVAGSHLILDLIEVGHITGASHQTSTTTGAYPKPPPLPRLHPSKSKPRGILRAHGGDDAYEMMPSPATPSDRDRLPHYIESWKAPSEWSTPGLEYEYDDYTEPRRKEKDSKGIRTILREATREPSQMIAEPTRSVQWVDRRCYVSPGEAV